MFSNIQRQGGAFMRWITYIFTVIALCTVLVAVPMITAQADAIELTEYEGQEANVFFQGILVEGDVIHVASAVTVGDQTLASKCFVLTENEELIPCTKNCGRGTRSAFVITTPTGHTYRINNEGEVYRWTPEGEEPWQHVFSNPILEEIYEKGIFHEEPYYAASDTKIFEVYKDYDDDHQWKISAYDMVTGERKELYQIPYNELPIIFTMPDGSLLVGYAARTPFLRIHDDGTVDELFTSDLDWYGLSNPECQSVIYIEGKGYLMLVDGALYQLDDEGKTTFLNYAPPYRPRGGFGGNHLVYLPGHDAVGFVTYKNYQADSVFNIIPLEPQNVTLVSLGGIPLSRFDSGNVYGLAFESNIPNVKLVSPAEYNTEKFADVAQWLTGKDDKCDLFLLHTADDGVQNVIRKGYFAPLQDDPDLTAYVEELYPGWRELVTAPDGSLAALPVYVGGNTSLGYHRELWEQEELGPLPTTYAELLDCIQRWDEEGKLELLCLFGYRKNTVACLTDMLLSANAAHYASQGQTPVYSNETLLSLLGRLDDMRDQLRAYDDKRVKGEPLLERSFTAGLEVSYENRIYTTLYLGFEGPEDVAIPRTLYAYVINPYSQHQAEAKAFLNTLVHQMDEVTRFGLVDGDNQGVEMEGYAEGIQHTNESIELTRAQLEEARAGGVNEETIRMLESDVAALQDSLAYLQENRYDITPEAAAGYRSTMERPALNRADGFALVKGNAQSTITAFNDGKISARDLCRKLDEVVRMWVMENQ